MFWRGLRSPLEEGIGEQNGLGGVDSIGHQAEDFLELFHFISLIIKCINTRIKHK